MKLFNLKSLVLATILCLPLAAGAGDKIGGGGDASEMRVNEIRADILKWISEGGARNLQMPSDLTYETYEKRMSEILTPKFVVISFTSDEDEVTVNGEHKTCKSYVSRELNAPHILCHIKRFEDTSEANQYSLIHHEYAGLRLIEKNEGAASDYFLSTQITSNLVKTTVLRLAVKPQAEVTSHADCEINLVNFGYYKKDEDALRILKNKNFKVLEESTGNPLILRTEILGEKNLFIGYITFRNDYWRVTTAQETVTRMVGETVVELTKGAQDYAFERDTLPQLYKKFGKLQKASVLSALEKLGTCKALLPIPR